MSILYAIIWSVCIIYSIYIIHSINMIEILYIWYMQDVYTHWRIYIYIYVHEKLLSWNLFAFCYTDSLSRPDRNQSVIALVGTPTR